MEQYHRQSLKCGLLYYTGNQFWYTIHLTQSAFQTENGVAAASNWQQRFYVEIAGTS